MMKLDATFAREVRKAANGDGSREARLAFLKPAKEAARKMSSPDVMEEFDNIVREYGRATVGLCVAVTAFENRDRLDSDTVQWAREVLKLWTNKPRDRMCLYINDGLHPTRIEEYAGSLMKLTTEISQEDDVRWESEMGGTGGMGGLC